MNRNDKKAKRDYISTHIDTSKARLKDDEVGFSLRVHRWV